MHIIKIPYYSDSSIYFEKIRHFTWPIFLDSSYQSLMKKNKLVHYDVLTANPFFKVILLDNNEVAIHDLIQKKITQSKKNPLKILEGIMQKYKIPKNEYPFVGGALGYISYDMNIDNNKSFVKKDFLITSKIYENTDKKNYKEKFEAVKEYLKKGDCYQVNLSKKYMVKTFGDPWDFYCKFRQINKSPFMAFLQFDGNTLLSGSPERFLKSNNGQVSTRPIKGTSARGSNAAEDKKNINILKNSSKEQAENLMIVDLLRNDLGVNCKSGSIKVDELFVIESYPNVHHLVSSIKGLLKDESSVFALFNDAFPGGSITGAPKKRAMEIINELESHARDLYCGSIVYFSFDGKLDSNIAIRSMIHNDDTLHFYSGGGLTIQSSVDAEYKEIEDKVNNIKKTILFFKRKDNA